MVDAKGHLKRHVYALIVAQLKDDGFPQAATAVASATFTPLESGLPQERLLHLVRKGLAAESAEDAHVRSSTATPPKSPDPSGTTPAAYGPLPPAAAAHDFGASAQGAKGASKAFPDYDNKHMTEHKNMVRCARFSCDGRYLATGSADTSIKLFEVDTLRQIMSAKARRDHDVRPVFRIFFDHSQPVNDLDFHPQSAVLISGSMDRTIKLFDFAKLSAKKAFRVIQDTHNVRSVTFHPCGDFLLAGTDHALPHLYDVNTFQCFLSAAIHDSHVGGPINQVRYNNVGSMYATGSKDGGVRIWDGVSAQCVRAMPAAHGPAPATSVAFTQDSRYLLSCGKDSTVRLWEVGSGRQVFCYTGAQHTQTRCQARFSADENFVLSVDEATSEVVVWDSMTAEEVARLPSGHIGPPKWLEHSPSEPAFVTCGEDRSVRFFREAAEGPDDMAEQ